VYGECVCVCVKQTCVHTHLRSLSHTHGHRHTYTNIHSHTHILTHTCAFTCDICTLCSAGKTHTCTYTRTYTIHKHMQNRFANDITPHNVCAHTYTRTSHSSSMYVHIRTHANTRKHKHTSKHPHTRNHQPHTLTHPPTRPPTHPRANAHTVHTTNPSSSYYLDHLRLI